jgi:hypothetical protein
MDYNPDTGFHSDCKSGLATSHSAACGRIMSDAFNDGMPHINPLSTFAATHVCGSALSPSAIQAKLNTKLTASSLIACSHHLLSASQAGSL